jgi:hypothetical protein
MFSQHPIRIVGAISIDNEYTREYVSTMKEFHRTFKLIKEDNLIEKQFVPHILVNPIMPVINTNNTTSNTSSLTKTALTNNRKTRKKRNT